MDAATLAQLSKSVWFDRNAYLRAAQLLAPPEAQSSVCSNSCQRKEACTKSDPSVARPTAQDRGVNVPHAALVREINEMRDKIEKSLKAEELVTGVSLSERVKRLEEENRKLHECFNNLKECMECLQKQFFKKAHSGPTVEVKAVAPTPKETKSDDDVDLFGSEEESEEDEEKERIRKERLMAYEAKKSKKPVAAAKSSVVLEVKPWDDETDMKEMESRVRSIEMDGLVWGASKLVPVGYGIKKLQIMCVVEDEKVSLEVLSEQIEAFEDFVQSVDIAAFNKI